MTRRASNEQGAVLAEDIAAKPVRHRTLPPDPTTVAASPLGSTHDVHGGGDPRLIATFDDSIDLNIALGAGGVPRVYPLRAGENTIGSDPASTIVLPDVSNSQAVVRRDEVDDYVIFDTSPEHSTFVDGRYAAGRRLHAGDRIAMGKWTFIYERAEFADHGSPYGGHTGGLPHGTRRSQPTPRPRGTSPAGGAEPAGSDPGEYY